MQHDFDIIGEKHSIYADKYLSISTMIVYSFSPYLLHFTLHAKCAMTGENSHPIYFAVLTMI